MRYRTGQFMAQLRPTLSAADWTLVLETLGDNSPLLALFERMSPADQRHAVAVLRTLQDQHPYQDIAPVLAQAALLHDVGKALGQPIFYRVAVVLLQALWPQALHWLGHAPLTCAPWRRPFVVNVQHPQIGADWLTAIKAPNELITLVAEHQQPPPLPPHTPLARYRLQLYQADNAN